MADSFIYCMNLEDYKAFESAGSSELSVAVKEGNRISQISPDSKITLYITDKNGFSAHLTATSKAIELGDTAKVAVTKVISVPEKDFVGWKVMQDNLDWLRVYPPKTWNPEIGGELRKLHYPKDNQVIFRSMEMALEWPKAEKKPKLVPKSVKDPTASVKDPVAKAEKPAEK